MNELARFLVYFVLAMLALDTPCLLGLAGSIPWWAAVAWGIESVFVGLVLLLALHPASPWAVGT